jgi:hypothetical protein
MATVGNKITEHDVVALREAIGTWAAGTSGTVVSDYGETKLIEISDERGATLDLIQVPSTKLDVTRH